MVNSARSAQPKHFAQWNQSALHVALPLERIQEAGCCRRSGRIGGLLRRVQRTEVSRENPQIPPAKTVPVIRSPLCRRRAFVPNWSNQNAEAFNIYQEEECPRQAMRRPDCGLVA